MFDHTCLLDVLEWYVYFGLFDYIDCAECNELLCEECVSFDNCQKGKWHFDHIPLHLLSYAL